MSFTQLLLVGELDLMEKNLCSALCKIRNEPVDAKEVCFVLSLMRKF